MRGAIKRQLPKVSSAGHGSRWKFSLSECGAVDAPIRIDHSRNAKESILVSNEMGAVGREEIGIAIFVKRKMTNLIATRGWSSK